MWVWVVINDGLMKIYEMPDFVSYDEMKDKYGYGNMFPVHSFPR